MLRRIEKELNGLSKKPLISQKNRKTNERTRGVRPSSSRRPEADPRSTRRTAGTPPRPAQPLKKYFNVFQREKKMARFFQPFYREERKKIKNIKEHKDFPFLQE